FSGGIFSVPAYFNGRVYYGSRKLPIYAFALTNAMLSTTPVAQTLNSFDFPGTTVSISANNTSNGIVWAVEKVFNNASVLHAYDATTLVELYNSQQAPGSR